MTAVELASWLEWAKDKKEKALEDSRHYKRSGEWPMQKAMESKAVAYGEMIDKLTRATVIS